MRRQFLLASLGAIALTGSALAADLTPPPPPPPYIPPPPVFTWTGVYIGGQVGGAWGTGSNLFTGFDPFFPPAGVFINTNLSGNPSGVIGGAHLGYQVQINQWILGIEGSVDGTSLSKTVGVAFPDGTAATVHSSADVQGSIRGKLGIAWDRFMIYGTGGVAFGGFNTTVNVSSPGFVGINPVTGLPFAFGPFFANGSFSNTRVGWTAGGGAQYAITPNWWVFAEYRFTDFGTIREGVFPNLPTGFFFNGSRRIQQNQVQAGFSYKFDILPPPPVVAKY
jgi:outer membrane immunogenic protein